MAAGSATRSMPRDGGSVLGLLRGRAPSVRAALLFGLLCATLTLAIRLWLKWVGPLPGDGWVKEHHDSVWLQPTLVLDLGTFFSVIGTPAVAALTTLVGLVFVARRFGIRGVLFVLLAGTGVIVNAGLKELSGPTPLMLALNANAPNPDHLLNYPSGHTVYGVTVFGALAALAVRAGRREVALPLLALIALMGPFRVISGAHFVSDVIAGYLVGFAWLAFAAALTLRRQ
ncbi:MAG: phosphatase PAP2 family protein [Patulibacter minatonensis]